MRSMRRRRVAAWLVSLPLMAVGSEIAHALAYRWVYPNSQLRLRELLATGHGYMDHGSSVPMALGAVFAIEAVALSWTLAATVRRRTPRPVPAAAFALLPLIAFACQELTERWLESGSFPWWTFSQPTFRAGELLQLPVGIVVWLAARLLLRAAREAAEIVWLHGPHPLLQTPRGILVAIAAARPRVRLSFSRPQVRGPPLSARATAAANA
jgi:hypothetical protein